MSRTAWIVGGLALAGAGTVTLIALSGDDNDEEGSKSKKGGKGERGKTVDTSPPTTFRLDGPGLKSVVCTARDASSGRELGKVLRDLRTKIRQSGADQVDLRRTGLLDEVLSAAAADEELETGIEQAEAVPGFLWPAAQAQVRSKLSVLPACEAPVQTWNMAAAGELQSAVVFGAAPEILWGLGRLLEEAE